MASKTIKLDKPVELHGKRVTDIVLKEPSGGLFLDHGEPRIYSRTADGAIFAVEDKAAVRAYLDECVDHENGGDLLRLISVEDVRRVKRALFSFFDGAAETSST